MRKSERFRIIGPDGYAIRFAEPTQAPVGNQAGLVSFYYRESTKYFVHMFTPDACYEIYTKDHAMGLVGPPAVRHEGVSDEGKVYRRNYFYLTVGDWTLKEAASKDHIPLADVPSVISSEAAARVAAMFPGIFGEDV